MCMRELLLSVSFAASGVGFKVSLRLTVPK